jgi:hypothetical protein
MRLSRLFMVLGLIIMGIFSQFLPHPPNFASMNAIALLSPSYLENRRLSFAAVVPILFFNDLMYGFHSTMPFVYLSMGLIIWMGNGLKKTMSLRLLPLACFAAALLFFLIVNFGVWLTSSLYPKTLTGLGWCYFAAIPFFMNQILGDLFYGFCFYYLHCVWKFVQKKQTHDQPINSKLSLGPKFL